MRRKTTRKSKPQRPAHKQKAASKKKTASKKGSPEIIEDIEIVSPVQEQPSPLPGDGAGDLEGLETDETEGFESVAELADEGQDLQAEEMEGIEDAPSVEQGPLKPRKVPNRTRPEKFQDRGRI